MKIEIAQYDNIILFDGICNFCNGAVNFVIDRDATKRYKFVSLQSDLGQAILIHFNRNTRDFDTLLVLQQGQLLQKSAAILAIAKGMDGAWKWLKYFGLLPNSLLDVGYNLIAQNRYRLFGKSDACRMPTPEMKERFL